MGGLVIIMVEDLGTDKATYKTNGQLGKKMFGQYHMTDYI